MGGFQPYLELCFYFADVPEWKALEVLVKAFVNLGARLTGEGVAFQGPGIRDKPFGSLFDLASELDDQIIAFEPSKLEEVLADKDILMHAVYLQNASDVDSENVTEYVSYLDISNEASVVDRHPLALFGQGGDLSFFESYKQAQNEKAIERVRGLGIQAYKRFLNVVDLTRPSYASIMFDEDLQCPLDMLLQGYEFEFNDFYVSTAYIGTDGIEALRRVYSNLGAYIEELEDGLYISTWELLNPLDISVKWEALKPVRTYARNLIAALRTERPMKDKEQDQEKFRD